MSVFNQSILVYSWNRVKKRFDQVEGTLSQQGAKAKHFSQAFLTTKDNKRCFLSREVKGPKPSNA